MNNSVFSLFYLWNEWLKKLIKTNIDNQQTIYDEKILFLKNQAAVLRETNKAKHIYLTFVSMDDHRTIRTKWTRVKNPRNTSPFQHDRKTGTIKQISDTITNCDLKMASADLRCTEHCCSEKSSEIALCFLTTRWMQMNIKV